MVLTTSNQVRETHTCASNYRREIVQKVKPPNRVEYMLDQFIHNEWDGVTNDIANGDSSNELKDDSNHR